jgi:hypothetical protein
MLLGQRWLFGLGVGQTEMSDRVALSGFLVLGCRFSELP